MILPEKEPPPNPAQLPRARWSGPPPSRWYVSNGAAVVGPVDTDLLLRGITSARIPNDCMVIQESWACWRALSEIRELSRITRPFSWTMPEGQVAPGMPEALVQEAHDAGEALLYAIHAAVLATRAAAGLAHRVREPFVGLVTSSAHGSGMDRLLGTVVPRLDPALVVARRGEIMLGSPSDNDALGAVGRRFSAHGKNIAGVAMVPVFDGGRLLGVLEVARVDHAFRNEDAAVLQKIARLVSLK
jgi:GAF domain-containing protein